MNLTASKPQWVSTGELSPGWWVCSLCGVTMRTPQDHENQIISCGCCGQEWTKYIYWSERDSSDEWVLTKPITRTHGLPNIYSESAAARRYLLNSLSSLFEKARDRRITTMEIHKFDREARSALQKMIREKKLSPLDWDVGWVHKDDYMEFNPLPRASFIRGHLPVLLEYQYPEGFEHLGAVLMSMNHSHRRLEWGDVAVKFDSVGPQELLFAFGWSSFGVSFTTWKSRSPDVTEIVQVIMKKMGWPDLTDNPSVQRLRLLWTD